MASESENNLITIQVVTVTRKIVRQLENMGTEQTVATDANDLVMVL